MNITRTKTIAALAGAALVVPLGAAAVSADVFHEGPPQQFGPPLQAICDNLDTAAAAAAGYNVVVLNNFANVYNGTPNADAIFALGGDDQIQGGPGDDLICLGDGDDRARGNAGQDVVYGENDDDRIQGNPGNDYLDGGPGMDGCLGGPGLDVGNACELFIQ